MKFLVTHDLKKVPLLRYLILFVTLFILFFLVSDVALHHTQIGLTLEKVTSTLYGNEERFEEPILLGSLLLTVHIDWFFSMLVVLTLLAIYIRLYEKSKSTKKWIHLFSFLGIFTPLLLLLSFLIKSKVLVVAWIGMFTLWHIVAFYLGVKSLLKLIRL